ncbi:MAG: hypothetical protein mread185_000542 [Mycoplasmataceae bacterium]|nr:MAG: hypothetical protein mread185_000542 [Mycoplasmataceae bacterium]
MLSEQEKRRIVNSCQTCRNPIYEGESIYTSSKGQSSRYVNGSYGSKNFSNYRVGGHGEYYDSSHLSENWVQCSWCYDQWRTELVINKKFWIKWWLGGGLLIFIATIANINIFPGLEESSSKITWYRINFFSLGKWKISIATLLLFLILLILTKFLGGLFQPAADRYKMRKRPIKL